MLAHMDKLKAAGPLPPPKRAPIDPADPHRPGLVRACLLSCRVVSCCAHSNPSHTLSCVRVCVHWILACLAPRFVCGYRAWCTLGLTTA